MKITISEIVKATGGRLLCGSAGLVAENIMLDSRTSLGNDLFIPIKGEKTDGHKYISGAFERGAVASLTAEHDEGSAPALQGAGPRALIRVEDTVEALQKLGAHLRAGLQMPFVGITGSVGKTSTREMITCALSAEKKVTSTKGNSNGQLGVPVTLSLMDTEAEIAVTEMGISLPGEMSKITAIARPDVALITNIGVSHIEQLGSQENILKEKLHITDGFGPENILLVNGDDKLLRPLKDKITGFKVLTFGLGEDNDFKRSAYDFTLQVPGIHNELNGVAALAVCEVMGVSTKAAIKALENFTGFGRRLEFRQMKGFTIIDDSYNASPDSMKAALQVLGSQPCDGRRIAVLADMLELGPDSPAYHREVGEYAAKAGIDACFTIGGLTLHTERPIFEAGIPVFHYSSNDALGRALGTYIKKGDLILTKGSNGMHLNEVVKALEDVNLD